jgi:hypothetical protein
MLNDDDDDDVLWQESVSNKSVESFKMFVQTKKKSVFLSSRFVIVSGCFFG